MGKPREPEHADAEHPQTIRAVAEVFDALIGTENLLGILHGLEGYPDKIGRDIDVMVAPNDAESVYGHIRRTLEQSGWEVGVHKMAIGVDQVFARQRDPDGKSHWLEFDLIHRHPFCWMGQEIVPTSFSGGDLIHENGWPVYPWGWFAKNLLIQALAGNEKKFRTNSTEFQKHTPYFPHVRAKARELGFEGVTELLISEQDSAPFSQLRNRARKHVVLRACHPTYWARDLQSLPPWFKKTLKLHFPDLGCAPKVHVVCKSANRASDLLDLLQEYFKVGFPFTSVILKKGRSLRHSGTSVFCRAWELQTEGKAYQIRDSSRIVLRIETWDSIEAVPTDDDSRITPGDFVHIVKDTDLNAEARTLGEAISDAFLANLTAPTETAA